MAHHLPHAGARRKNTGVEKTFGLKPQEFSDIGSRYMSKRRKIPFFSGFHSRVAAFDGISKGAVGTILEFLVTGTPYPKRERAIFPPIRAGKAF